jgi:hypothetical protein
MALDLMLVTWTQQVSSPRNFASDLQQLTWSRELTRCHRPNSPRRDKQCPRCKRLLSSQDRGLQHHSHHAHRLGLHRRYGSLFRSYVSVSDFPTGSTGNICTVRCRNNAVAGPFGGCFAVQQTDGTAAVNTASNIQTAQTLEGITARKSHTFLNPDSCLSSRRSQTNFSTQKLPPTTKISQQPLKRTKMPVSLALHKTSPPPTNFLA